MLYNAHDNHKENTCRRYTKENEKGIKTCNWKKINKTQRLQERKEGKITKTYRKQLTNGNRIVSFPYQELL